MPVRGQPRTWLLCVERMKFMPRMDIRAIKQVLPLAPLTPFTCLSIQKFGRLSTLLLLKLKKERSCHGHPCNDARLDREVSHAVVRVAVADGQACNQRMKPRCECAGHRNSSVLA
eukprot:6193226-Pleurochrysis_carterae.AAC.1